MKPSKRPHFLTPSAWGLGFSTNSGGHKPSVHDELAFTRQLLSCSKQFHALLQAESAPRELKAGQGCSLAVNTVSSPRRQAVYARQGFKHFMKSKLFNSPTSPCPKSSIYVSLMRSPWQKLAVCPSSQSELAAEPGLELRQLGARPHGDHELCHFSGSTEGNATTL